MMQNGLDPITIVFALVAIFVVWKLKAVLGTRTDIEKRPPTENRPLSPVSGRTAPDETGKIVRLPGASERLAANIQRDPHRFDSFTSSPAVRAGLLEIAQADPNFDPAHFIEGAKIAYEMIITAFAEGDKKTLSGLLNQDVMASFSSVIDQRLSAGDQANTKFVSIETIDITDAGVKDGMAQISLRILAKMINSVTDKAGTVLSGDPLTVVSSDDLWTFARPITSRDPAWRLIATESDH